MHVTNTTMPLFYIVAFKIYALISFEHKHINALLEEHGYQVTQATLALL